MLILENSQLSVRLTAENSLSVRLADGTEVEQCASACSVSNAVRSGDALTFDLNSHFLRIQSAHSLANAFWVSPLRNFTSNSVP